MAFIYLLHGKHNLPTSVQLFVLLILAGAFYIYYPEGFIMHCHVPFDIDPYELCRVQLTMTWWKTEYVLFNVLRPFHQCHSYR
jgi:hypothetical protein